MLGHRALRQTEMGGQVDNPVLTQSQMLHDGEPGSVAEPVEQARSRDQCRFLAHDLGIAEDFHHRHLAMMARSLCGSQPKLLTLNLDSDRSLADAYR